MGLHKGHTNNPQGRPPGVPNKINKELKERLKMFLDDNFEVLQEDFKKLEPKQRFDVFVAILRHVMPELRYDEFKFANLNTEDLQKLTDNILNKLMTNKNG